LGGGVAGMCAPLVHSGQQVLAVGPLRAPVRGSDGAGRRVQVGARPAAAAAPPIPTLVLLPLTLAAGVAARGAGIVAARPHELPRRGRPAGSAARCAGCLPLLGRLRVVWHERGGRRRPCAHKLGPLRPAICGRGRGKEVAACTHAAHSTAQCPTALGRGPTAGRLSCGTLPLAGTRARRRTRLPTGHGTDMRWRIARQRFRCKPGCSQHPEGRACAGEGTSVASRGARAR